LLITNTKVSGQGKAYSALILFMTSVIVLARMLCAGPGLDEDVAFP